MSTDHDSPLRGALEEAIADTKLSLKDLTVLAVQNDPFRVDTPARHRDGEWLAVTARDLGLGDRRIHLRGLHYMVIGRAKPDGTPYTNTESDWLWLSGDAGKAARWLGYIPFEQIVDQRNTPPTVRAFKNPHPRPYISAGVDVEIPDADEFVPGAGCSDFKGVQPFKLVLFGEKSSLEDVLGPIAESRGADLYLPTGEISDTLMHHMATVAVADGRPMRVFCFSDCDPAGWQMPISIARKLQAFARLYEMPHFEVRRVALTPDHVRAHGLPSTPLKDTERRADKWKEAMGVEQTEIDALAALQPDLLRRIARDALAPFYDTSLDRRVTEARWEWIEQAQAIIDNQTDQDSLDRLRAEADSKLTELRSEIDALNDALRLDADDFELPEITIPEPELNGAGDGKPLLDSGWSFVDQCKTLIDSKAYRQNGRRP
jgi:hypothetical protein